MTLETPTCPKCGQPATGTVERVEVVAQFDGDPSKGAVEHTGNTETEIDWGTLQAVTDDELAGGNPLVRCAEGHEWASEILDED